MVDWFRVVADLKRAGMSARAVARDTNIEPTRLHRAQRGIDLRHRDGEALLLLWSEKTGRPASDPPRVAGSESIDRALVLKLLGVKIPPPAPRPTATVLPWPSLLAATDDQAEKDRRAA